MARQKVSRTSISSRSTRRTSRRVVKKTTRRVAKRTTRRISKPKHHIRTKTNSSITKDYIYLDPHDEEKVLLFTAGILFGVGASVSVFLEAFTFGGLALIAVGAVLLLIEKRQEQQ